MNLECPICLEALRNSVAFTCGHSCCHQCLQATDLQLCPICRMKITSTTPSPWLDTKLNSNKPEDEDEDSLDSCLKSSYFDRPILDPRGHVLRQVHGTMVEMLRDCHVVSEVPAIIQDNEEVIRGIKTQYNAKIKALEKELQTRIEKQNKKTQALVDVEETRVKQQEYQIQAIDYLSQTFLALSVQSTEVLDQALPVYQDKLDWYTFDWPLGITPYDPPKTIIDGIRLYIPECNEFLYSNNGVIHLGKIELNFDEMDKIIKIRYNNGLIYIMTEDNMFIFNTNLELIDMYPLVDGQKDFYIKDNQVIPVILKRKYEYMTTIDNTEFLFLINSVGDIEFVGESLYVYESFVDHTYIHNSNGLSETKKGKFVVSDNHVIFYQYDNEKDKTIITMQDGSEQAFDGKGILYPNANNTALYRIGNKARVIQLESNRLNLTRK